MRPEVQDYFIALEMETSSPEEYPIQFTVASFYSSDLMYVFLMNTPFRIYKEALIDYFEHLPEIVRTTVSFGIAIGIGTPPEDVAPFIPFISTIQCMGTATIGYQGQPFDVRAIAQVRKAKELYPDKTISVDGGVNRASLPLLVEAGADACVVGSTIFQNDNPRGTIKELKDLS